MATEKEVKEFHESSDLNGGRLAQHHTLGVGPHEGSPGNHNHNGSNSKLEIVPLTGTTITGSRATDAWRLSVNAALVKLGALDSSTP